MSDALSSLAEFIRTGLAGEPGGARSVLEALFGSGGRYQKRHLESGMIRDAFGLAGSETDDGIPFAALINSDNPPSGPYGGASIAWFPTKDHGSLLTLVVGTRGLSPDEGLLTRPGHRRRTAALRRYLTREGVQAWTKPDPSALGVQVPKSAIDVFPDFDRALKRYGYEIYCAVAVPRQDPAKARVCVQALFDLYAYERRWQVLGDCRSEYDQFHAALLEDLFPRIDSAQVNALLRARRFVVLQGPPGTGKTRMAEQVRKEHFDGRGMTIQFHPAVAYEDFVIGLSPDPQHGSLRFEVRPGHLLQAAQNSLDAPYLLVIDEINRADLGRVLGEAIYLLEADEIGTEAARTVQLPHAVAGTKKFSIPANLYILATMNTADRSIAGIDLAIRRRFSFVTMMPERRVVDAQQLPLATAIFRDLCNLFVEHAPAEGLNLLPGHAYFLAKNEDELRQRLRYQLLPLLDEYLREGYLGGASSELYALRDAIEDRIGQNVAS
jgi:5-methylcytosine-specific restriction protein B